MSRYGGYGILPKVPGQNVPLNAKRVPPYYRRERQAHHTEGAPRWGCFSAPRRFPVSLPRCWRRCNTPDPSYPRRGRSQSPLPSPGVCRRWSAGTAEHTDPQFFLPIMTSTANLVFKTEKETVFTPIIHGTCFEKVC